MSTLVFGRYCETGNEGADFQVGACPVLDPYDGFFDQALDAVKPGDDLLFLLDEGNLSWLSTKKCKQLAARFETS